MTRQDVLARMLQTVEFWRNQDDSCPHGLDNCHICLAQACTATLIDILQHPTGEPTLVGFRWQRDVIVVDEQSVCPDCGFGYQTSMQAKECSRRHHSEEAWRG
jgi:hypothetical protein